MPALKFFKKDIMIAKIFDKINPVISGLGYEIVDIERSMQYNQKHLTVFIDKVPEGISLDDCEKVHYAIEAILDEDDPFGGQGYVLEISSPGLDRPFASQRDYERNYGKDIEIKLFAPLKGKKVFEGKLIEKSDNFVIIEIKNEQTKIEMSRISLVRPLIKFE